jgi:tripartite-type tricarboxylate transporter receptor subunit TctC
MRQYHPPRLFAATSLGLGLLLAPTHVWPGEWPAHTVKIVTPFAPGISVDVAARALADAFPRYWKQPVVVENRPGADTIVGTQAFLEARDGHTLLFTTHSTFTVVPLLRAKLPYNPVADVTPISLAVEDFITIVVSPTLGINSLPGFVALARKQPAKLNFYAVPGAPYLAYLAFQKRAGLDTIFVPYNSPVSAISDLAEGRVHVGVMPLASVLGAVQAAKIKLLAVTNAERTPAAPDVPTVAEAGHPDFTFGGFLGLFGPRNMQPELCERVASEVKEIVTRPEVRQRLMNVGLITRGSTPAEFASLIEAQRAKWSAIAREHNIEPQ